MKKPPINHLRKVSHGSKANRRCALFDAYAYGLAKELEADHITVLAVSPGWMRTELVLAAFNTDEEHWQTVKELEQTESTHYIGRAICSLANDPAVQQKTGQILRVGELAEEYGFTDLDGRRIPPFYL